MASSSSILALDSAGRLDRELTSIAAHVDDLRDLLQGDARASLLVQSLALAIVTAQQLRIQVLHVAETSAKGSVDLYERTMRARLNIVVRALYALKSSESWIPHDAFARRFRALRDISVYLADRVGQIHAQWTEQRAMYQQADAWMRQTLAYTALDDAEIAFERIGRDPDLEHFVRVGAGCTCAAVRLASHELAVTFGLALAAPREDAAEARAPSSRVDRSAS